MRYFPLTVLQDCNEIGHGSQYQFQGIMADKQYGGGPLTINTESADLIWGDYSLRGHESSLAIERKTLPDLFGSVGSRRMQFKEEIEALSTYRMAAVVVEANFLDITANPPPNSEMDPRIVARTVLSWWARWPTVGWFFFSDRKFSERLTFRLLERYFVNLMEEKEQRRFRYPLLPIHHSSE